MTKTRYYRKVIRITAEDSPNVKLAREQEARGMVPTGEMVVPGVISWQEYLKRRDKWSPPRQSVGLDARFWMGEDLLLFPPNRINRAEAIAAAAGYDRSRGNAIGMDPAEGGDKSTWCVGNPFGLVKMVSVLTQDTSIIPKFTIALMEQYHVPPNRVVFDRGGGGKQHADRLRDMGVPVRTVGFGDKIVMEPRRGMTQVEEKKEHMEEARTYRNRRAQMYWQASELLDPAADGRGEVWELLARLAPGRTTWGFGIPAEYSELTRQLSLIPKLWDEHGVAYMLPKTKPHATSTVKTLIDIIGHSPDEADAFVLMVHGLLHAERVVKAGAAA